MAHEPQREPERLPQPEPLPEPLPESGPHPQPLPLPQPLPQPPTHEARARAFDTVAAQYATARPGYPPSLHDAVEELAGRPLAGARVLDVGAGTGLATAPLAARGARVTAVEPGAAMAAELHRAHPALPVVRARGEALPFPDGAGFDLVTYAQAWHWTDPARSVPEALRVLRPGGTLALWWNVPDPDVPWQAAQEARLARRLPGYHRHNAAVTAPDVLTALALPGPPLRPATRLLHWTRRVPLPTHLAMLGSRSHCAALGPEAAPALAAEDAVLREVFPDGVVEEAYALHLTAVRRADG
ncbi:class I SAM-dependent methyltransferase [Streptomyces sp. NBC_01525]|uniref:class I SAM-dependent methyltransferase n=1 Tax=Streptomyces sp. NBC_01525 TaxID=2903893 RepID=UPI0038665995